jgi:hypothetical protein
MHAFNPASPQKLLILSVLSSVFQNNKKKFARIKLNENKNERRPHQFVFYENISDNMTFG